MPSPRPTTSPRIGLGTAPGPGRTADDLAPAIRAALDAGCTLFDTAEVYGSEPTLRRVWRELDVDRGALELVTKLWQTNHAPEHVLEACRGSLRRLAVEAIDLYLVHSPESWRYLGPLEIEPHSTRHSIEPRVVPRTAVGEVESGGVALHDTWEAMLDLARRGLARQVGLANVGVAELEGLAGRGLEPPAAIQIEVHPLRPEPELRRYCAERAIRVLAQSPLAAGRLIRHPVVRRLAAELGASPSRVVLRWHLDSGVEPIAGSGRAEHARENAVPLEQALPVAAGRDLDRLADAAAD